MRLGAHRGQKGVRGPGAEATGGCDLPDVATGNQIQIFL